MARLNLHPGEPDGQNYQGEIYFENYNGYVILITPEIRQGGDISELMIVSVDYSPDYVSQSQDTSESDTALIPAPDFELKTIEGEVIRLSDFKGKVILLSFWAEWCSDCTDQFSDFQQVFVDNADTLVIIGVNDTRKDHIDLVETFLKESDYTFPIVLDEVGRTVNKDYQILGFPTNIFIDKNGFIAEVHHGRIDKTELEEKLLELKWTIRK